MEKKKLKLCDSAEWSIDGAVGPPVAELPVLSGPHEELLASVSGLVIHGPESFHHVAGVDVAAAEVILHRLAVFTELHHVTLEVGSVVDANAVGPPSGLEECENLQGRKKINKNTFFFGQIFF